MFRLFRLSRKAPRPAARPLRLVMQERAALALSQDTAARAALAPAPRLFLFLFR